MRNQIVTQSKLQNPDDVLEPQIFRALADPSRRQILDRLVMGDASVNELAERFPTSRPAISRHLRVLREAALVVERRAGRKRVYSLNPQPLSAADAWLGKHRVFWAARLQALKAMVESDSSASNSNPLSKRTRSPPDELARNVLVRCPRRDDLRHTRSRAWRPRTGYGRMPLAYRSRESSQPDHEGPRRAVPGLHSARYTHPLGWSDALFGILGFFDGSKAGASGHRA